MIQNKITFGIDREEIKHYHYIKISQSINDHHYFEVSLPHSVIEEPRAYTLQSAHQWEGSVVHIALENQNNFLGVVENVSFKKAQDSVGAEIIVTGRSKTVLLESGKKLHSWEDLTLQDMIREIIRANTQDQLQSDIKPEFTYSIPFQAQYLETDFQYIQRLAKQYNEWLFYDGEKLFFGKPQKEQERIKLMCDRDIYNFNISVQAKHNKLSVHTYNNDYDKIYKVQTQDKVEGLPRLGNEAVENAAKIYPTTSFEHDILNTGDEILLQMMLKKRQEASVADANYVTASSRNNKLKIGSIIEIDYQQELSPNNAAITGKDASKKNYHTTTIGTYIITEIKHEATNIAQYENHFKAIPAFVKTLPEPQVSLPEAFTQRAIVIDNADPKGQGRVRVQMLWQKTKNLRGPWVQVMTPDAGTSGEVATNRGFVFIPEVGDHVMLGFTHNDPNQPFVLGSMFSGITGTGGQEENHLKSIFMRGGSTITFNELEKSILIKDPSGNSALMDGNGNITYNAPKNMNLFAGENITMTASNNIIVNSGNNTEFNVSRNMILNVMTQLFIFTPALKQVVSGFMSMFSGKALINSANAINIEAKELTTHGTEKMLVHSDKLTTINSKEVAEMHGATKNSFTNKPEAVEKSKYEFIAKATVYFRPLDTWNGEFGFDWLRVNDNNLNTEPSYADIIEGGYKNGIADFTRGATGTAYAQLKTQYPIIPIRKKPTDSSATPPDEEYFVPYLTLFSKEFVTKLAAQPIPPTILPKYEADIKILLEIEEDVDKLQFVYDENLFEISKTILADKAKTTGLVQSQDISIKVTCLKDLDIDKEISIYAYPKGSTTIASRATLDPGIDQRILAGKIIVLKNDATTRKEEKFVLVDVWTDVNGDGTKEKGSFNPIDKLNFYNHCYQSLIIPIVEDSPNILDLSRNTDFKSWGKYISSNNLNEDVPGMFAEMKRLFLGDKDSKGGLKNSKYTTGYFTAFAMEVETYDNAPGQVEGIGIRNLVLFNSRRYSTTMAHETFHGLGLYHTHREDKETVIINRNKKYIFQRATTTNAMSYNTGNRKSLWRWQWHITNPNISEK